MVNNKFLRHNLKLNIKNNKNVNDVKNKPEYLKLLNLLKRTVLYGESNSLLLIGPAGSGKNFVVETALDELYNSKDTKKLFSLVKLNGLLHTDDKIALKTIIKQLILENDIEDCSNKSFAENLSIILECFKSKNSKNLIFILDEFELFCSHHNQTLLYNLFDVAQSAQSPIFVLGLTCNNSVVELLEKRVKSRFSHRKITLFPTVDNRLQDLILLESLSDENLCDIQKWNKYILNILEDKNVQKAFKLSSDLTKNHNDISNIFLQFISLLQDNYKWPDASDLTQLFTNSYNEDSQINLLTGFSILEMCLLIAMKHHCEIYDDQPFNFKMIYTRYCKFCNSSVGIQVEPQRVAMKAFQHIVQLECIVPITGQIQYEHQMFKLTVSFEQISLAIKKCNDLPTSITQWALSSIL